MSQTAPDLASEGWKKTSAGDGTSLAYRITKGEGVGRIALVHSLAMDATFWDRVIPLLVPHVGEILTYDCRGHGRSDKPRHAYTVDQFADDLKSIMEDAGWEAAVIAGTSMGGCIALAFAAAYPEKVMGLGLIDTTSWYGPDAPTQWAERGQKAFDEGLETLVGFQKSRWVSEAFLKAEPEVVDAAIAVFLANDRHAYAATCNMLGAADIRHALSGFSFPCRILVGEEDYATPVEMAKAMADAIPGAQMRVIDGARHLTPLEVPGDVASDLLALVRAKA